MKYLSLFYGLILVSLLFYWERLQVAGAWDRAPDQLVQDYPTPDEQITSALINNFPVYNEDLYSPESYPLIWDRYNHSVQEKIPLEWTEDGVSLQERDKNKIGILAYVPELTFQQFKAALQFSIGHSVKSIFSLSGELKKVEQQIFTSAERKNKIGKIREKLLEQVKALQITRSKLHFLSPELEIYFGEVIASQSTLDEYLALNSSEAGTSLPQLLSDIQNLELAQKPKNAVTPVGVSAISPAAGAMGAQVGAELITGQEVPLCGLARATEVRRAIINIRDVPSLTRIVLASGDPNSDTFSCLSVAIHLRTDPRERGKVILDPVQASYVVFPQGDKHLVTPQEWEELILAVTGSPASKAESEQNRNSWGTQSKDSPLPPSAKNKNR